MTFDELREELEAGTLRPAYLLVGSEPLLRDDALAAIRGAALDAGAEDWNHDRLDGPGVTPVRMREAVEALPVMASRRLVVLREPEAGRRSKALVEALPDVIASCDPDGGCVLVVSAERADARARWVKAFGKSRLDCEPPRRARELVAFVRTEAKRQGVELERGAAELLAERIGPQLLVLRQEIAKAALLAGDAAAVTRAHVGAGTIDIAEEPIWDLTDAIGEGRTADALGALTGLLGAGAAPPQLLGALVGHFRRLLRLAGGEAPSGPAFVQRKLQSQARRYGRRRLLSCLRAIHSTDLALKGAGGLRPELALERLVLGLSA